MKNTKRPSNTPATSNDSADRWEAREEALMKVIIPYLTPMQAASALDQWEAVLAARPELTISHLTSRCR